METTPKQTTATERLRQRIDDWRRTKAHRSARMPAELWTHAVDLAQVGGAYATSRGLGISYQALRERLGEVSVEPAEAGEAAVFVDLGRISSSESRVVIHLEGRRGNRMRVELAALSVDAMVGLTDSFWSHES